MKIYRKHGALIVESEAIVKFSGWLMAGPYGAKQAKASAFVPFVFVRKSDYVTPVFINHERIHFKQQLETLIIGMWLLLIVEYIYSRLFLKLKSPDYYLYRASEQEAYRNQHDLSYLENRQNFSVFKYLKDKRKITFVNDRPPEVVIGEKWLI